MSKYFELLQLAVKSRGPSPLVTWISDMGRIELSAVTFANAVSKASNFLIDGLELDEDSSITVDLGNHWQSPVWLGTGLATGIKVTNEIGAKIFGTLAAAQGWSGEAEDFIVISQDPFGMPTKDVPAGFINGSAEVRNFGDYFAPAWPTAPNDIAFASADENFTWDQLVSHTLDLANQYGIKPTHNYGLQGEGNPLTKIALQVVLPVIQQNSVVLIDQANPDVDAIRKQEKLEQLVVLS
jgi:uncharacterized protein (TIGR03089 family)